jgi:hypothetical protein
VHARLAGLAGFAAAVALPVVLWHRAIELVAAEFRLEVSYLVTGWTGWAMIGLGLLFLLPVVATIGRAPGGRFYPRGRKAYLAWGVSLYLMGAALASQVSAAVAVASTP